MVLAIHPPSISKIRADLITEKIGKSSVNFSNLPITIIATGRTGSGKSTGGNLLIGEDAFLESTGFQDCTKEINYIDFNNGLIYVDLPGIASDDRLENYNRLALGINQVNKFPQVNEITLAKYQKGNPVQRTSYNSTQWNPLLNPQTLILYLVAPQTQFLREDSKYLADLLKHKPQIVYVLNLFVDRNTETNYIATPQNISDTIARITKVHQDVLGKTSTPTIVKLNCLTGEGLDNLLECSLNKLGGERGKFFKDIITYQADKTPLVYLEKTKHELLKAAAYLACQKPDNEFNTTILFTACKSLWEFFGQVLNISKPIPLSLQELINSQAAIVISQNIERHYEVVTCKMSKRINKPEPRYKTVHYLVDDPNNPIWTTETIRHYFLGIHYDTTYNRYISGFNKKTVSRQEFSHYENVYSHTDYWQEKTGEKRLVGQTYHYLREAGVSFWLTFCYLLVAELLAKGDEVLTQEQRKQRCKILQKEIKQKMEVLSQFPQKPTQEIVLALLEPQINRLFDSSFNKMVLRIFQGYNCW